MEEEPLMVKDKLDDIREWLLYMDDEDRHERLSYGEIAQIDHIHDSVRVFTREN